MWLSVTDTVSLITTVGLSQVNIAHAIQSHVGSQVPSPSAPILHWPSMNDDGEISSIERVCWLFSWRPNISMDPARLYTDLCTVWNSWLKSTDILPTVTFSHWTVHIDWTLLIGTQVPLLPLLMLLLSRRNKFIISMWSDLTLPLKELESESLRYVTRPNHADDWCRKGCYLHKIHVLA